MHITKAALCLGGMLAIGYMSARAEAPGGPPPGFFPQGMSNGGTRYNTYCAADGRTCVERMVKAWGQVCHAGSDEDNTDSPVPLGFRYDSWRCVTDNPDDMPLGGKSGR